MTRQKLPPNDHVVRYVPWARLRKDDNDKVIGILGDAFKLREDEKALSATWLEYFPGERTEQVTGAVQAIRASSLKVGSKSGFAIGKVATVKAACASRRYKIRIVHEPDDDNKAHVAVRQVPRDDPVLLELLAEEAWAELHLNAQIPSGRAPAP